MKQLLTNIHNHTNERKSLSDLRGILKKEEQKTLFYPLFLEYQTDICACLNAEDAKTRKNAVLLIGDMGELLCKKADADATQAADTLTALLYEAYKKESTLFVKESYLLALKDYDYAHLLPSLKKELILLSDIEQDDTNKKHISSQQRAITDLIVAKEGIKKHTFTGYDKSCECILLTNRLHKNITEAQIADDTAEIKPFNAGVRLVTSHLEKVLQVRTYQELLFLVPGMTTLDTDPLQAAKKVCNSYLLEFLKKRHNGSIPFYFRVELKSKLPLDKRSQFTKRFSAELERLTDRQLINSANNYELELRLIANKTGTYNTLVKLFTIPDDRFSYRKEYQSSSIKPVNAALLVALASKYMQEGARVLDPFCGVGTMLIERQKAVRADTSYGVDISAEALAKAKTNTLEAGQVIHYINRDFASFTHEYQFDEIFTDMPFAMGNISKEEVYKTYKDLFTHAKTLLSKDGTIILYSHDKDYVIRLAKENGYQIIKQFVISEKENTHLFVIK